MLKPITKKISDESDSGIYRFTFYCDICGAPHQSVPYESETLNKIDPARREAEHNAAYERANREIMNHFNRCPMCGRVVCDNCFRILDESDMCFECAATRA